MGGDAEVKPDIAAEGAALAADPRTSLDEASDGHDEPLGEDESLRLILYDPWPPFETAVR